MSPAADCRGRAAAVSAPDFSVAEACRGAPRQVQGTSGLRLNLLTWFRSGDACATGSKHADAIDSSLVESHCRTTWPNWAVQAHPQQRCNCRLEQPSGWEQAEQTPSSGYGKASVTTHLLRPAVSAPSLPLATSPATTVSLRSNVGPSSLSLSPPPRGMLLAASAADRCPFSSGNVGHCGSVAVSDGANAASATACHGRSGIQVSTGIRWITALVW